jgi:hypothetical protein
MRSSRFYSLQPRPVEDVQHPTQHLRILEGQPLSIGAVLKAIPMDSENPYTTQCHCEEPSLNSP